MFRGIPPPLQSRNKTVSSSYHSTRSSYSSCCSWSKSDYCRNRHGVAIMEQHVRRWTLPLSGIAGGLRWTFRRHPHHSARCSRLSASLYLGKRNRSFSASSQVQKLLWQVGALNLKPQFAQMQCSPYLEWIETAMNQTGWASVGFSTNMRFRKWALLNWLDGRCGHAPNHLGSSPLLAWIWVPIFLMKKRLVPPKLGLVFFPNKTSSRESIEERVWSDYQIRQGCVSFLT